MEMREEERRGPWSTFIMITYHSVIIDDGLKSMRNSDHTATFEFFFKRRLYLDISFKVDTVEKAKEPRQYTAVDAKYGRHIS